MNMFRVLFGVILIFLLSACYWENTEENAMLKYELGLAYSGAGRYQEAIEAFNETLRIKPDFIYAHYELGQVYDKLGSYKDAIEAYKQAIRFKPDLVIAHYSIGMTYIEIGDREMALKHYEILNKYDPEKGNNLLEKIKNKLLFNDYTDYNQITQIKKY